MFNKRYVCRICRPFEYFSETKQLHLHLLVLHSLYAMDEKMMPLFDNVDYVPAVEKTDNSVKTTISSVLAEQATTSHQKVMAKSALDAAIASGIERGVSKAMQNNSTRPIRSSPYHSRGGKPNFSRGGRGSHQANRKSGNVRAIASKEKFKTETDNDALDFPSYEDLRRDVMKTKFPNRHD